MQSSWSLSLGVCCCWVANQVITWACVCQDDAILNAVKFWWFLSKGDRWDHFGRFYQKLYWEVFTTRNESFQWKVNRDLRAAQSNSQLKGMMVDWFPWQPVMRSYYCKSVRLYYMARVNWCEVGAAQEAEEEWKRDILPMIVVEKESEFTWLPWKVSEGVSEKDKGI